MAEAEDNVTIIINAVDKASARLKHIEQTLKGLGGTAGSIGGGFGTMSNLLAGGLTAAGTVLNLVTGAFRILGSIAGSVMHAVIGLVERTVETIVGLGHKLLWIGGILAGLATMVSYRIGRSALEFGGWMQQVDIAFASMIGNAKKAKEFIGKLWQMQFKMPVTFKELVDATRQFFAYGFKLPEIPKWMTTISDTVAAFGGSMELFRRVTMAIGQIKAKGFPSGEEFRQLAEAGIPAWQMLAEYMGVTVPVAMKRAESRAVDGVTALNALMTGMQKRFTGMGVKLMATLPGVMTNLIATWQGAMIKLGTTLAPTATRIIRGLAAVIQRFADTGAIEKVGNRIAGWFSEKNLIKAATFLGSIANAAQLLFHLLRSGWDKVVDFFTGETQIQKIANFFGTFYAFGVQVFDWLKAKGKELWGEFLNIPLGFGIDVGTVIDTLKVLKRINQELGVSPAVPQAGPHPIWQRGMGKRTKESQDVSDWLMNRYRGMIGFAQTIKQTGRIPGLVGGMTNWIEAFREGMKDVLDPMKDALEGTEDNTGETAKNTSDMKASLSKILGGGELAKSALTRFTFGGAAAPRLRSQTVTIRLEGGTADQRSLASQVAGQLLGALGIPTTGALPSVRGSTV